MNLIINTVGGQLLTLTPEMLWEKAYERGHSNGFNEVYYAIEDYEEVVIEALKGKR